MQLKQLIQLFSTVWLLIMLLLINAAIYYLFYNIMTNSEVARVSDEAALIVQTVQPGVNEADKTALLRAFLSENGMIRIINEKEEALLTVAQKRDLANISGRFLRAETADVTEINQELYVTAYHPMIWDNGEVVTLEVTESLARTTESLQTLKIVLVAASLLILIPAFFAGRLLGNVILKPINAMIETMEDIQRSGSFKQIAIKRKAKDELYKMATTFNKMIRLLERNFVKQQQFVSDASHELKTPLTIIQSYANMLKRWGMKRQDVLEESIDAIYSETLRMKELTEQMLLLANDEDKWRLERSTIHLLSLCQDSRKMFETVYERDILIHGGEEPVYVDGDEQKLKQVLFILLDNALKYSHDAIHIFIGKQKDNAYIVVEDDGAGIPKDKLDRVFDRFYRVDEARTRESGGTGLGLAIAKKIVDAHDGNITIDSDVGQGTKVTVSLPRAK